MRMKIEDFKVIVDRLCAQYPDCEVVHLDRGNGYSMPIFYPAKSDDIKSHHANMLVLGVGLARE